MELDSVRSETAAFKKIYGMSIGSNASANATAKLGSDDPKATAKVELKFGSEGSFLYHLKDITNIQFKERQVAFEKIGQLILSEKIKWKDEYVLVVEVKPFIQGGEFFKITPRWWTWHLH